MPLLPHPLQDALRRIRARALERSQDADGGADGLPETRPVRRAVRRVCPNPYSQRERWAAYLAERPHLKALQLHLRARGHRATIVRSSVLGPGVRDEAGSLHMTFGGMDLRAKSRECHPSQATVAQRRRHRNSRPTWPLFTLWQEKRLVLLKRPQRRLTGLKAHR